MQTYSVTFVKFADNKYVWKDKTYKAQNIDNLRKRLIAEVLSKNPSWDIQIAAVHKGGKEWLGRLYKAYRQSFYVWGSDPEKGMFGDPTVDPKTGKLRRD